MSENRLGEQKTALAAAAYQALADGDFARAEALAREHNALPAPPEAQPIQPGE